MRYAEFKALVADKGWTLAQVRCEVPPNDDLLALMDEIGLAPYERFALRMTRESKTVTVPE